MSDVILAIDTSCDDTSAAVVRGGSQILSNVVSGQTLVHERFGGIVPELASRRHLEIIEGVVDEAMKTADMSFSSVSAVAVCRGPGLIGSLIVGTAFAKALAYIHKLPLIGVNHLEGHICSAFLKEGGPPELPFISLVVSGGHTSLYRVDNRGSYRELGRSRDDAAGEAYDKVAKMLALGFPGGPVIDRLAKTGNPRAVPFPRAYMPQTLDFSFSGLKTSVRNFIAQSTNNVPVQDICASFQAAVIDVLIKKIEWAAAQEGITTVALSGGVAANDGLRQQITRLNGIKAYCPPKPLCTDNAAMIGAAAYGQFLKGEFEDLSLNPKAYLPVG
ncbi:tRNA (adenosine(37)-N6)-threonylcarbamoyltransferase complex transferase subunit TsaD [Candidatus Magnetominusculus xianensis]|uniref:tRNA N6-adenosine threonylcarbamoyltransferase n=1 Tax=Candidatus Magnetominusculus xianensis TaxID=1748249 RepID=A0ABR5SDM9_9BACT|nr:tRNA (adenosine(37)-N6)-threonylcarbamoyltransferase complex transferase subunit TsaD [Candidatus Magnetominusculus xianensis]KWT78200.1 tRNA threonylcarbamoyladenosine modification protein [Candidatus Magnetominusculus xianensis]MBF0402848.1 tRNA (adenosine(37)-N6)-threonylcarbamoyltransferase complex transferase subunit TsaD [Nitrospirota bacterium]